VHYIFTCDISVLQTRDNLQEETRAVVQEERRGIRDGWLQLPYTLRF